MSRPWTRVLLVGLGLFFGLMPGVWAAFLRTRRSTSG